MHKRICVLFLTVLLLSGCLSQLDISNVHLKSAVDAVKMTRTPFQPILPTTTPLPTATPTPLPLASLTYSLDPSVPTGMAEQVSWPAEIQPGADSSSASVYLGVNPEGTVKWVYALAVPFSSLTDEVSLQDLQRTWRGEQTGLFNNQPLLLDAHTLAAFEALWGAASTEMVRVVEPERLCDEAWNLKTWAIVPFDELQVRWKVLRVDGMSPYDKNLDLQSYPLVISFALAGKQDDLQMVQSLVSIPAGNRDPEKLSIVLITGVTALVRATGERMERKGMDYPAQDILPWLKDTDLLHISNEVSFTPTCPAANPMSTSLQFCSRMEYFDLLTTIGVNVMELSGNHLLDWSQEAFENSLQMYRDHNIPYYAGGENLEEARKPLLLEDHGNKFAFMGCNPAGPSNDWATDSRPGTATCDYDWMEQEIQRLKSDGYSVIVTLQYNESYSYKPGAYQQRDFRRLSNAGADVISGSQAHYPQGFELNGNKLIHYGPGNLFFDQMHIVINDVAIDETRKEFLDRHVFYDGRYLGVDLLTALLEDYAKPRPMTAEERAVFLSDVFQASGWK
jgi:poly-gamma-glutamate synthesis protein (capsule biosynthesis protein)